MKYSPTLCPTTCRFISKYQQVQSSQDMRRISDAQYDCHEFDLCSSSSKFELLYQGFNAKAAHLTKASHVSEIAGRKISITSISKNQGLWRYMSRRQKHYTHCHASEESLFWQVRSKNGKKDKCRDEKQNIFHMLRADEIWLAKWSFHFSRMCQNLNSEAHRRDRILTTTMHQKIFRLGLERVCRKPFICVKNCTFSHCFSLERALLTVSSLSQASQSLTGDTNIPENRLMAAWSNNLLETQ